MLKYDDLRDLREAGVISPQQEALIWERKKKRWAVEAQGREFDEKWAAKRSRFQRLCYRLGLRYKIR